MPLLLSSAKLINFAEAARLLAVSKQTIRALVTGGELPACRVRRRRLIPAEALEDFIRRNTSTAETASLVVADQSAGKSYRRAG
jgi:excisionase family DNA binding protein